jgi:hypothetical protein
MIEEIQLCPLCEKDPTSHSFSKIREMDGIAIFYTSPAKSKNIDRKDILQHYDITLRQNREQRWIWIFDCEKFPISHMLDFQMPIELAKLIREKYATTLEKIVIINPTFFIRLLLNFVSIFLTDEMKHRIYISEQKYDLL